MIYEKIYQIIQINVYIYTVLQHILQNIYITILYNGSFGKYIQIRQYCYTCIYIYIYICICVNCMTSLWFTQNFCIAFRLFNDWNGRSSWDSQILLNIKNRHVYAQATQQVYNVQRTSANQYAYLIWFLKHIFLHMDRARTFFVVFYDNFSQKKPWNKNMAKVASFLAWIRLLVAVQAACSRSSTCCGPNSSALCAKRQLFPCLKNRDFPHGLMVPWPSYKRIN